MQSVYLGRTRHFLLRTRCNNAGTYSGNAFWETSNEHKYQIPFYHRDHVFVDPDGPSSTCPTYQHAPSI